MDQAASNLTYRPTTDRTASIRVATPPNLDETQRLRALLINANPVTQPPSGNGTFVPMRATASTNYLSSIKPLDPKALSQIKPRFTPEQEKKPGIQPSPAVVQMCDKATQTDESSFAQGSN